MEDSQGTTPSFLTQSAAGQDTVIRLPFDAGSQPPDSAGEKKPAGLWYALYFPQLENLSDVRGQECLQQLAALAGNVSGNVSIHSRSLILEVRSSLHYFGGLDVIHERLRPLLGEQLGAWELSADFQYAACPTPTGSLLLARAGHNTVVYQRQNLRSALGRLPATVLEVDPEQQRRLHNMGVRYLRDIWRLPTDGLRKRFGSEFVNQINRAVGKRPEPLKYYQPPPVFRSKYELPCSVENLELLMPVVDEIIAQLMDFLTRRDLSVSQLLLSLHHEQQDTTEITLGLRQPSRSPRHLMLLLETHLNNTVLPAPVENVTVEVKQFDACQGQTGSLLNDGISVPTTSRDYSFSRFMEQMQARLGQHHLQSISCVAEHCPEYASRQQDSQDQPPKRSKAIAVTDRPRPFWLLPTPRQLVVRNGRLYHRRSLRILSGPERIETRWWSGMDIRRDYYVAMEENGCRLWIYHDKTAGRHWYLHGVFA